MYGLNYEGLHKRETYNEIIDYIQYGQEKIIYPDRTAKQIRNSPQLSNLLDGDGDGLEKMDEHQKRQIEEVVKENIIRNTASENNESAKVLRAKAKPKMRDRLSQTENPVMNERFSQTKNPTMKDSGMQAWRPNVDSSGFQTEFGKKYATSFSQTPPQFDMAAGDAEDDFSMDVDSVIDINTQNVQRQSEQVKQIVENHLGQMIEHSIPFLSSSTGAEPMEINPQQKRSLPKRNILTPAAKARIEPVSEAVILEPKGKAKARSTSRRGTRQETNNPEEAPRRARSRPPPALQPAMSSTDIPQPAMSSTDIPNQPTAKAKAKAKAKAAAAPVEPEETPKTAPVKKSINKEKPIHDTTKDENKNPKYWERKSVGYIIDQLQQHRGVRFTKEQLKGTNKLKKNELVQMIKEKLKI